MPVITIMIIALVVAAVLFTVVQIHSLNYTKLPEKRIQDFTLVGNTLLTQSGKIVVIFIGAEACPYCTAESWSIVEALQQYGKLTGLTKITSNSSEKFPNITGYGFSNASLNSTKIAFWEDETSNSEPSQNLQDFNSTGKSLFQKYDSRGAIPFLLIGGVYLHLGSGFSPNLLVNSNWTDIEKQIPTSRIGAEISAEASNISAAIKYVSDHKELFEVPNKGAMAGQNQELPMQMPEQIERI
jgi:hypothetical protein